MPPTLVQLRVVSFFVQSYDGLSQPPPNHPHVLISGRATITEELCGMRFLVSPGAFFQVNSGAAELLYSLVRDLAVHGAAGLPPGGPLQQSVAADSDAAGSEAVPAKVEAATGNLAVLDVCCGTGTIGIVCSPLASRVVGVELSEDAIADAIANAQLNGVANASFICSRAEDVMPRLLSLAARDGPGSASAASGSGAALAPEALLDAPLPAQGSSAGAPARSSAVTVIKSVVAILDPPRGGVHMDVIRALRTCKLIKRIVYVSCNPTGSFVEDAVRLCAPQEDRSGFARGPAFHTVASVPVDLFPHTHHTELVTLFERD